jgi:hypothetical protein
MNNNMPKWTNAISRGDFGAAEEELSNAAAQRIISRIEQAYVQSLYERRSHNWVVRRAARFKASTFLAF